VTAVETYGPGVYELTDEEYFGGALARASLSSTGARELLKPGGPARFRHKLDTGTLEVRREFDLGHAVHTLVLQSGPTPVKVPGSGKDPEAWRTDADKERVAVLRAEGKVPLRPADFYAACAMATAVLDHPLAAKLLRTGEPERTLIWHDPVTGVMCRAKVDWLRADGMVDLKTTESAAPDALSKAALNYGYAIQAPFYLRGFRELRQLARASRSSCTSPSRRPRRTWCTSTSSPSGPWPGATGRCPPRWRSTATAWRPTRGPATPPTRSPTSTCPRGCGRRSTDDRYRDP
jgi:hypothetical protein